MKSAILVTKADGTQHIVGPFASAELAQAHEPDADGWPQSYKLDILDFVEPEYGEYIIVQESDLINSELDPRGSVPEVALVRGFFSTQYDADVWASEEWGYKPTDGQSVPEGVKPLLPAVYVAKIQSWYYEPKSAQ